MNTLTVPTANVVSLSSDKCSYRNSLWTKVSAKRLESHRKGTHHGHLGAEAHAVLPRVAQHVGQVEHKVDEAGARRRQVGLGEEDADQEALCDRGRAERQQEHEHQRRVAVVQHAAVLR